MRRLLFLLVAVLCGLEGAISGQRIVAGQPVDELFTEPTAVLTGQGAGPAQGAAGPSQGTAGPGFSPGIRSGQGTDAIVSRALVGIRIEALFDRTDGVARRVRLNAGQHTWTAVLERVEVNGAGFRSWVGRIEGVAESHVVFTERDGIVSGLINAVGTTYQVRTVTQGTHILESVDLTRLGGESEPLLVPDAFAAPMSLGVAADDAGTFDVLMLYTPAARVRRGGTAQMEALVSQIISDTNTAFARSGITSRVRLVGTRELPFVEAAQMSTDLFALRASTDARALRDATRADLVQLLVNSPDQSACGVGYLLTSLGATSFDAYSLADVACAAQYTPTHEMGHNMGAHHAPEDGASGALFPYSYGFKDPARGFRTMMAYSCAGASCGRIPNFSNPLVTQNGGATGTASQSNARSIIEAAQTVANFRQAGTVPGFTPPGTPTGLRSSVSGGTVTVTWNPVLADVAMSPSAATAYLLQAGTAPGLSNVFNASVGHVTSASGTLGPGTYFWRVIALNSAGQSAPSADAQFTIGCAPPAPPSSLTFSVAARIVSLSWSASAGAAPVTYVLEAGSAPSSANLVVSNVGPQTTLVTPAPPGAYYVRVRAQDACGTSLPSNEQLITISGD